jgi:hypothetical protein
MHVDVSRMCPTKPDGKGGYLPARIKILGDLSNKIMNYRPLLKM